MFGRAALDRIASRTAFTPLLIGAALAGGMAHAGAQSELLPPLSVEQIAARMQQRTQDRGAALHSYVSHRVMTLTYKGVLLDRQASEVVDMTFTAPASKRFAVRSGSGSSLLRESVFQREMTSEQEAAVRGEVTVTPATYKMQVVGEERLPQGSCYVLQVAPRVKSKFGYKGKIWVVAPDFAVVRVQAMPVENPSFWLKASEFRTEFQKVGDFWFPALMVSASRVRFGGEATLTIEYGPYQIISAEPFATVASE